MAQAAAQSHSTYGGRDAVRHRLFRRVCRGPHRTPLAAWAAASAANGQRTAEKYRIHGLSRGGAAAAGSVRPGSACPAGTGALLRHAHRVRKENGFGAALRASGHFLAHGIADNIRLVPRMAMYVLPMAALAVMVTVFQTTIRQPYALEVQVDNETVAMWPTKRCSILRWKPCSSVSIIPVRSRRALPWSLLIPWPSPTT